MAIGFLTRIRNPSFTRKPTLFLRSIILILVELLANAVLWIVTVVVFKQHSNSGKLLSLALVAWTLGLRHGLDADHISAIDNATRRIASIPQITSKGRVMPRKPVTVGLFFSLGHSTIVIAVVMAVAISTLVASKLDGVSDVGGKIGAAISGSFLVLVAIINSVILIKTWKRLRRDNELEAGSLSLSHQTQRHPVEQDSDQRALEPRRTCPDVGLEDKNQAHAGDEVVGTGRSELQAQEPRRFSGLLTRIALPLLRLVTRPWHMYPVGVLFGFGFDTASSITLLSIATVAIRKNTTEDSVQSSDQSAPQVILLALLFTAGMSWVDSMDSIMMIYAYAFAPEKEKGERWWHLFESSVGEDRCVDKIKRQGESRTLTDIKVKTPTWSPSVIGHESFLEGSHQPPQASAGKVIGDPAKSQLLVSNSTFSSLSLLLTFLSILLAFAIGAIVLMGLIGDNCSRCSLAADKEDSSGEGGLEGRFWLAWRKANDQSGIVGACIVGVFALILAGYVFFKLASKRLKVTGTLACIFRFHPFR